MRYMALLFVFLSSCSSEPNVDLSQARPYQIMSTTDISVYGPLAHARLRATIYSDAVNYSKTVKAETTMKAARDIQRAHHVPFVVVYLNASPKKLLDNRGYIMANVWYSPDGTGVDGKRHDAYWDVEATNDKVDPIQIKEAELWTANEKRFTRDSSLNETALTALISKQLSIPPSDVLIPDYFLTPYHPH